MSDFNDAVESSDPAEPPADASRSYGLISSASAPAPTQVSQAWQDSAETETTPAPMAVEVPPTAAVELSAVEARVLGSLIEKSFLTPDTYPMTTNAMVTACNQKTNRDPVVDYTAVTIDAALLDMRQRNLVRRVHSAGSRSTKHRQTLDEALSLNEAQLALMSVLLLRGPQTIGELRLRTERHDVGFDDLDAVESCLVGLAGRATPLVMQLARQPGHKEARWQHLLDDDEAAAAAPEADDVVAAVPSAAERPAAGVVAPATPAGPDIHARVIELESQVATLRRQLASLADQLGASLE